jgi:hypothetical protein
MKRNIILIVFTLGFCLFVQANKQANIAAPVYLTVQAENGGLLKQLRNENGTVTCIFHPSDVIRIEAIIFNGQDVTSSLKGNKFITPVLTKDATLDISFEMPKSDWEQTNYRTIASFTP